MKYCCGEQQDTQSSRSEFEPLTDIIARFKEEPGSLIPVLQKAQELYGFLPIPLLNHIATELKIKKAHVFGVATFYAQFRLEPVGKFLVLLCQGTACHVNGSDRIEAALTEELKINIGETTPDTFFTLDSAACLGCCSLAPVMMINGQAYGPLTPDGARKTIREIRQKEEGKEGEPR